MDNKDMVLEEIMKIDIPVPETLDDKTRDTLAKLPLKKSRILKEISQAAAGLVIIIGLLSFFIYSNETFADIAMGVPGLKVLAELIRGDEGVKYAAENGYPVLDEVIYVQDGFKLVLSDILVDEERVSLQAKLFMVDEDLVQKQVAPGEFHLSIEGARGSSSSFGGEDYTSFDFSFVHDANTFIQDLIEQGENLIFTCQIRPNPRLADGYMDSETLVEFTIDNKDTSIYDREFDYLENTREDDEEPIRIEGIEVPISRETVLLNKEVPMNHRIELEGGVIEFDRLIVSPSQLNMVVNAHVEDKTYSVNGQTGRVLGLSFDLQELEVESNRISKASGARGWSHDEKIFQFVPSFYFDDIEEITVTYTSYFYELERAPIVIDADTQFPLAIDYFGYPVVIEDFYVDGDRVMIKSSYVENEDFRFQSLILKDTRTTTASYSDYENSDDGRTYKDSFMILEEPVAGHVYEIVFEYPQIIVHEGGSFKIDVSDY